MNYLKLFPLILFSSLKGIDISRADSLLNRTLVTSDTIQTISSVSDQSPTILSLISKMGIMLIIVIAFIYLFVLFMKRLQSRKVRNGNFSKELYQPLGIAPLTYNKQLQVVKFYNKLYLLGVSEKDVTLIDKFEKGEEIRDIENSIDATVKESFTSIFSKAIGKNKDE